MPEKMRGIEPIATVGKPKLLRNGRAVRSDWSPDNQQIVYGGTLGLGILDLQTGQTRSLLPFGKDPTWSPKLQSG